MTIIRGFMHHQQTKESAMSKWNHSVCEACWFDANPDRIPVRVPDSDRRLCCLCGKPTISGIYVRHDPAKLNCHHDED